MSFELGGKRVEDLGVAHRVDVAGFTGAASLTIPIPTPAGRSRLQPELALVYTSGRGNTGFGAGWELSGLPEIGLDLRDRLPRWDGSDPYQLNGDELVPWMDAAGLRRGTTVGEWAVLFLRSRRGESAVRVERWVHVGTGRIHFRTRDANNVITIFGARNGSEARIADVEDPSRTLAWLPEIQVDPHGNAVWYEYAAETLDGVERAAPFEQRTPSVAQRYLKRIRYGNTAPVTLADDVLAGAHPSQVSWCFQVVFDYGDHGGLSLSPDRPWSLRPDPASDHRGGFPVRTYRLCRRILIAHEFAELGPGPTLVTAIELSHDLDPAGSTLREVASVGYRRDGASRRVPPLRMAYAPAGTESVEAVTEHFDDVPAGFAGLDHTFVDLHGEGLAGILSEVDGCWYYKRNLGGGAFGEQTLVRERPATLRGTFALGDSDRDGDTELQRIAGRLAGSFELEREGGAWSGFRPFPALPHAEAFGGRAQWVDLNGDGRADLVIARADSLVWFASDGDGFAPPIEVPHPIADGGPLVAADPVLGLSFADMTGDGLPDLVRVRNGSVEYWPSLGNGRFGERVVLEDAPQFARDGEFESARVRFADLDGSGTSDVVYLGHGEVTCWINACGNRLLPGPRLGGLPMFDQVSSVQILDFHGDGRACLVWSTPLPGRECPISVIPLTPAVPARFLLRIDNSLGRMTQLSYASSARHYRRDTLSGRGWSTRLPTHAIVAERREVIDEISGSRSTTRFAYHDGFYDGRERGLRGFGHVDTYDADWVDGTDDPHGAAFAAPSLTRTWFHLGTAMWNHHRPAETYDGDPDLQALPPHVLVDGEPLTPDQIEDGLRALAGQPLRLETFAVAANDARDSHPFEVSQLSYELRCVQLGRGEIPPAFQALQRETATWTYERAAEDPRVKHAIVIETDDRGVAVRTAEISYARRANITRDVLAQDRTWIIVHDREVVHRDELDRYELSVSIQSRRLELVGVAGSEHGFISREELRRPEVVASLASPIGFHVELADTPADGPRARLLAWERRHYWDSARQAAMPVGEIGQPCLVHHDESACFSPELVAEVFGGRVVPARLAEVGYLEADGVWWKGTGTQQYAPEGDFLLPVSLLRGDGATTTYSYDADRLALVATTDAFGTRTSAEIDYHVVAPWRVTDPNGNVSEVRYDPLGVVTAATQYGHVNDQPWGQSPLAALTASAATSLADVLAAPSSLLGGVQTIRWYDLETWQRDRTPLVAAQLTREGLANDGTGATGSETRVQITIDYLDGFSRGLQTKSLVDPGPAVQRDPAGRLVVDAAGYPVLAPTTTRWLASGHVVYDAKQRPGRRHEPFFTTTAKFEPDAIGAGTLSRYDAIGRAVGEHYPDGTFTRTSFGPWSVTTEDRNDTVLTSMYRTLREGLPADTPDRAAYESAASHANTPVVAYLDPLGRPTGKAELGGATAADRRTETELDAAGNPRRIRDPRGLAAFVSRYDMVGGLLHQLSVDAGEAWSLPDAYGRVVTTWDARGYRVDRTYDHADRPISTHVVGNGLDHRVEEHTYGEALADRSAAMRGNLLGRVISSRDASGETTIADYDPRGQPMRERRQLRRDVEGEPDWRGTVGLDPEHFETSAVYDALGRAVREVLAGGAIRTYEYAGQGAVERIRLTLPGSTLVELPVLDGAAWGPRGEPLSATFGNGIDLAYAYDHDTARLTSQRAARGARVLQALRYTRDPAGNIVRITDGAHEGAGALIQNAAISSRRDYRYDAHYRLRSATGRVHQGLLPHDHLSTTGHLGMNNGAALERFTRTYDYDASGNLTAMAHTGATHSWRTEFWISGASNRSLPALDAAGNTIVTPELAFDTCGNLSVQAHLRRMGWNWRGELSRAALIERPGGTDDAECYVYAADGTRARKVTTRVVHGGQLEVTERTYLGAAERKRILRDGAVLLERWTTHVHDGSRRIASIHRWVKDDLAREVDALDSPRVHYSLSTHQGSAALELDQAGALISYEEYFPYGGTALVAGDNAREVQLKDYRYSGKECDDATGLYYYGYRYLAPWLGRWISPDPAGPKDDLNLYQFVLGDPVGNVDPDGLETFFERNDYRGPPVALPSGSLVGAARPPPVAAAASGTSPTRATADVGVRAFVDGIFGKDGRSATVVKNDESTTAPAQLQSAGKNANRTTPPIVGPDPIKPVSTSDAAPTSSASIAPGNVDTSTGSVEASLPGHSLGPSRHAWTLAEVNKQLDVNGDRVITAVEVGNLSSIKGISGEAWAEMMAASPEFSGYAVDPTVHSVIAEVRQEHAVNRSNDLARAEYLNDTNLRAGRDGINLTKREDREAARRDANPQGSPRRLLALGLVGFTVMFPQAAAVLGAFKTGVDTGQAIGGRHFNGDPLTDDERRGKVVDALVGGVAMGFAGYAAAQAGETIALETSVPSVAPEAELSIAYAPGLPGHNKIGITVDGETQWIELIASEEESEFSANRAIQSSQLTFGDRPAWIQFGSTINPRYQLATMPITRGQAASALAEANAIAANPGRYGILTNSCTTFCRSVMSAAGKQPAWWARSPGLLFKSVP